MLVAYGTTEGHTREVAARIAETARAEGMEVEVVEVAAATAPSQIPVGMPSSLERQFTKSATTQASVTCEGQLVAAATPPERLFLSESFRSGLASLTPAGSAQVHHSVSQ